METLQEELETARSLFWRRVSWLGLGICLGITFLGCGLAERYEHRREADRCHRRAHDVAGLLVERLGTYQLMLMGCEGLFASSTQVTREEWRSYVERLELGPSYPGLRALEYARWVSPEERLGYETSVRAEGGEFSNYTVWPSGLRPDHLVVHYIEPRAGNERAFGFDLLSEANRSNTVARARVSERAVLSPVLQLAQDEGTTPIPSVLMMLDLRPHLTQPRLRNDRHGMVLAIFSLEPMLDAALGPDQESEVVELYQVVDGGKEERLLMHGSTQAREEDLRHGMTTTDVGMEFGGQRWRLHHHGKVDVGLFGLQWLPVGFLFVGLAVSGFVFWLLRSQSRSWRGALRIASGLASEVRQEQILLRRIIDSIPHMIFLKDAQGRFVLANRAIEQAHGVPSGGLVGRHQSEVTQDEGRLRAYLDFDREVLESGETRVAEEERVERSDGGLRLVRTVKVPVELRGVREGRHVLGISVDVTEEKRFEKALDALARLGGTGDTLLRGLAQVTMEFLNVRYVMVGEVVSVSGERRVSTRVLKESGRDLTNVEYALPGTPCSGVVEGRACVYAAGVAREFPEDAVLGRMQVEFYAGFPLKRAGGEVMGLLVGMDTVPRNLTRQEHSVMVIAASRASGEMERLRAERVISSLNMDLERRVVERTEQLTAVNRELEAFSYSVSHDLRAPLRNVVGFVELLEKQARLLPSEVCLKYLRLMASETHRMGVLIEDLLTFSRAGRAELMTGPVDLVLLMEEAKKTVLAGVTGREIEWTIGTCVPVRADPNLMRQVLTNLVDNAVKYTRERAVARIEFGEVESKGGQRVFVMRDNGVGFDMRFADKLFGVFQRLHSPKRFEGTGIGLANVYRILTRHGGRVWVEAEVEKGATFFFSLPT